MSDRKTYEMSQEQYDKMLKACQPTPAMFLSGGMLAFGTPQENANLAWQELGREMGFKWGTVSPIPDKSPLFFTAEPSDV
jgi:predicted TIM-barrel fold metal-dependent hydrolase